MCAEKGLSSLTFVFRSAVVSIWCVIGRELMALNILCRVFNCVWSKVAEKCCCEGVLDVIFWAVFLIGCSLETLFAKATSVLFVNAFLQSPESFLLRTLIVEIVVCMFPFSI